MRKTKKRGRGRPATGHDPTITIRLAVALRREIDWLAEKEGVTRSEMFRMLLERGLKATR
jgi:metal-responsive CopG/Arc/MetJ family transcriptional regulator